MMCVPHELHARCIFAEPSTTPDELVQSRREHTGQAAARLGKISMITRRSFITSASALVAAHAAPNARALSSSLKVPPQPRIAWCVGSVSEGWIYTWATTKAEALSHWNLPFKPDGGLEIYREQLFDPYSDDGYVPENVLLRANWVVECGYCGRETTKETGAEVKEWAICNSCLPEVLLAVEYGPNWDDIGACFLWDHRVP
jgi:hypothetical protein